MRTGVGKLSFIRLLSAIFASRDERTAGDAALSGNVGNRQYLLFQ
jgi:hypothetical protein